MFRPARFRWTVWLITGLLAVAPLSMFIVAEPVAAATCKYVSCFEGREIWESPNYGSHALIDTGYPQTNGFNSFEFVGSFVGGTGSPLNRFVQTGWIVSPNCGSGTYAFWEWFDGTTYHNGCPYTVSGGQHSYYQETNSTDPSGYWCNGLDGSTLQCEYNSAVGISNGDYVDVYGETNDSTAQMGALRPGKINLTDVTFKPGPSGTITSPVTTYGDPHGTCDPGGDLSACPYGVDLGIDNAYGTMYTANYTY